MAITTNRGSGIWVLVANDDETRSPIVVDRLQFSAGAAGVCVVTDSNGLPVTTFRTAGADTKYLELHRKLNGVKVSSISGSNAALYVYEEAGVAG